MTRHACLAALDALSFAPLPSATHGATITMQRRVELAAARVAARMRADALAAAIARLPVCDVLDLG